MKRLVIKTVSLLLLLAFFADTCCYGLATLPASQNPLIKREILAALNRTQIRYAESEDAIKLLKANNASCLLLSSGKYLVTKEVAQNDATLLRAIIHEDIEAIMQILMDEGRRNKNNKYQGIKELILKYFSPTDGSDALETELYVNHTVAKAFEWLIPIADGIIIEDEIPGEVRDFISAIEPIIKANKHNYFNGEFWDSRVRGKRIRAALNNGMIFYQVANDDTVDKTASGLLNDLLNYTVPADLLEKAVRCDRADIFEKANIERKKIADRIISLRDTQIVPGIVKILNDRSKDPTINNSLDFLLVNILSEISGPEIIPELEDLFLANNGYLNNYHFALLRAGFPIEKSLDTISDAPSVLDQASKVFGIKEAVASGLKSNINEVLNTKIAATMGTWDTDREEKVNGPSDSLVVPIIIGTASLVATSAEEFIANINAILGLLSKIRNLEYEVALEYHTTISKGLRDDFMIAVLPYIARNTGSSERFIKALDIETEAVNIGRTVDKYIRSYKGYPSKSAIVSQDSERSLLEVLS